MMIAPLASPCTTDFIPAALASAISYLLDLNCPKCLFGGGGLRWDTQRALFCPGVGSEADFEAFFSIHAGQGEQGTWSCYLCGKVTLHSGNMRQHFEAYHFRLPIGLIQCRACAKTFKTRHSLATHMSKNHRDANKYWADKSTPFDSPGQLIIDLRNMGQSCVFQGHTTTFWRNACEPKCQEMKWHEHTTALFVENHAWTFLLPAFILSPSTFPTTTDTIVNFVQNSVKPKMPLLVTRSNADALSANKFAQNYKCLW